MAHLDVDKTETSDLDAALKIATDRVLAEAQEILISTENGGIFAMKADRLIMQADRFNRLRVKLAVAAGGPINGGPPKP